MALKGGLILVGIAVLVVGGAFLLRNTNTPALTPEPTSSIPASSSTPEPVVVEGGPAVDPVSLPAFSQRSFVGKDFKVGQVLAKNEAYTRYYITYKSGELTISGIMNVPVGDGPFPVLILNHGHIDTSIYTNGRGLKREQDYLARRGYVVIHPDYRGHAESDNDPNTDRQLRLGYAEDVINVIGAIRTANLPYMDTSRIGMLGHSMGGGVAWQISVTRPDLVKAIVFFAPVSADARDNFNKWITRRPEVAQAIIAEHGSIESNPVFWDNISPQTFFKNIATPLMIHHGTADASVPLEWSQRSEQALKAANKDITLHVYPGEPHEFIDAWGQVMARTVEFFNQHVKNS